MTPDSAGTMTAMMAGVKTKRKVIGVNSKVEPGNCSTRAGNEVESVADWAKAAGMKITTCFLLAVSNYPLLEHV